MGAGILGLRLALAVVFAVSGGAKAANRAGTRQAAADLGVPGRLTGVAAAVLPVIELAVALLLVPASTARPAAAVGAVALVAFTGLVVLNLARGRRPDCHCFGALSTKPISGWSVVRNVGLLAVAVVVAVSDGGRSLAAYTAAQLVVGTVLVVLAGAVAVLTWALFHLLRQHGRLLLRVEELEQRPVGAAPGPAAPAPHQHQHPQPDGLPVGSDAPAFSLEGLHGETMTLAALRAAGKPVLLVFSDPACGPCTTLAPDIARWQQEQADRLRVVLVSSGPADKNRAKAAEHGLVDVLLDPDRAVATSFRFNGTPGAVLVDIRGQIASPVVSGGPAITALVERVTKGVPVQLGSGPSHLHEPAPQPAPPAPKGLPVGAPAPEFRLPTVGGGEAALSEFRGGEVVVLFWNPRCGFCERMLPDLLRWEQDDGGPDRPALLVVSTGDEAANAAQGFTSTVLLDAAGSVMSAYGADGTPMAVRLDGDGRVISSLGIGAPGVTALLNGERVGGAA